MRLILTWHCNIILCESREALSGLKKEDRTVHAEDVLRMLEEVKD